MEIRNTLNSESAVSEPVTQPAEAKREPLTDDKVREIYGRDLMDYRDGDYMRFARAVEAAHGIVNIGAKEQ